MINSKDFMNDNYIPVTQGVMPLDAKYDVVPVTVPEEERTAGGSPGKAMGIIGTAAKIIKAIL